MKLIYIAGPMTSRAHIDYNFPKFDAARDFINGFSNLRAISPADMDRDLGFYGKPFGMPDTPNCQRKNIIKRDVDAILECDGMFMLHDWWLSTGAQAERKLAIWYGLYIFYQGSTEKILNEF